MTEKELRKKLMAFASGKTERQIAQELGVSQSYVHEILAGTRSITNPTILRKFGYKKVVRIEKS